MAESVPLEVVSTTDGTITILDGGTGHELKQRGISSDGSFFAGVLANERNQVMVEGVHCDFLNNGCDVVTTNSFVAVPLVMRQRGWSPDDESAKQRAQELIVASVGCAKRAAANCSGYTNTNTRGAPLVAGCVPPLTECYVGSKVPNEISELVPIYRFIIEVLLAEGVDLLLAETLTTTREAIAILQTISLICQKEKQQPSKMIQLWISFTIDDYSPETLRSGELLVTSIASVLDTAATLQTILCLDAIGVNCSAPYAISRAIPLVASTISIATSPSVNSTTDTTASCHKSSIVQKQKALLVHVPRILAYGNAFQTTTSEWLRSTNTNTNNTADSCNFINASLTTVVDKNQKQQPHSSFVVPPATDYDKNGCMLPEVYAKYTSEWVEAGASIVGGCCGCSPRHMQEVASKVKKMKVK